MKKKILLGLAVLLMAGVSAVILFVRKTPAMLEAVLENGLGKEVTLQGVQYRFPIAFEVRQLGIFEKGIFEGEKSFYVENVLLSISPSALLAKRFVINDVRMENPRIFVRKLNRRVVHALSPSEPQSQPSPAVRGEEKPRRPPGTGGSSAKIPPLFISRITVRDGLMQWIDYDIAREGFVVQFERIQAEVRDVSFGKESRRITYELEAEVAQGRERPRAKIKGRGWTHPLSLDTDSNVKIEGLWIPYFVPYYRKVVYSRVDRGLMSVQSTTTIENKDWTTNARVDLSDLELGGYEPNTELFGIDATTLVDLLRNQEGRITLDLVVRWNLNDPNATFRHVLRKSIERSLKATFMLNLKTVVENTLDKVGEEGSDFIKEDLKDIFKQIRQTVEPES